MNCKVLLDFLKINDQLDINNINKDPILLPIEILFENHFNIGLFKLSKNETLRKLFVQFEIPVERLTSIDLYDPSFFTFLENTILEDLIKNEIYTFNKFVVVKLSKINTDIRVVFYFNCND